MNSHLRFTLFLGFVLSVLTFSSLAPAASYSGYAGPRGDKPYPAMRRTLPPYLELGPMIGATSADETRIWAKASEECQMGVLIGTDKDLLNARKISGPELNEENGFMGHVRVRELQPATRYYYCLLLDGHRAMLRPYPSFQTAPQPGKGAHVRFAFTSCVGYHGFDAAAGYADMAVRTNIDFALMLGDNHYANSPLPEKQRPAYFSQRDTAGYRALGSDTPIYAIWDDHDFGPDNSDGTLKNKDIALKTFQEEWANPAYGEPGDPGVYFKFTWGEVDIFMLDGRYDRSPNKQTNQVNKTMLGAAQLEWFKQNLLASRAPVKVIASGSEFQLRGTEDSWRSFKRERDDLFEFIEENNIKGVLFISGDRHFTAAYQIKGKWIEVTSGPLGSSNATSKSVPDMFLYFDKGKMYCVYDIDTRGSEPKVTLEVYQAGGGLLKRRPFTWDEVLGKSRIEPLPPTPPQNK